MNTAELLMKHNEKNGLCSISFQFHFNISIISTQDWVEPLSLSVVISKT